MNTINETYEGETKKGKAHGFGTATGIDSYNGQFKNGYPHGKGTYVWKKSNVKFVGEWIKGKRHGKGKMIYSSDSIVEGYWVKNRYIGLYKTPFKLLDKTSEITNCTIKKLESEPNCIRCYVLINDKKVQKPKFTVHPTNGNYYNIVEAGDHIELQKVTFPFRAKLYYGKHYIEIEIFQGGMWDLRMEINEL